MGSDTIRRLHEIGYQLIECPAEEIQLYPANAITIEPHKYGGGIRCNTMQLIRDAGPKTFAPSAEP